MRISQQQQQCCDVCRWPVGQQQHIEQAEGCGWSLRLTGHVSASAGGAGRCSRCCCRGWHRVVSELLTLHYDCAWGFVNMVGSPHLHCACFCYSWCARLAPGRAKPSAFFRVFSLNNFSTQRIHVCLAFQQMGSGGLSVWHRGGNSQPSTCVAQCAGACNACPQPGRVSHMADIKNLGHNP